MGPSDPIALDTTVAQNDALVSAPVGDEVVMLHLEKNAYYDTDAVGAAIWHRLAEPIQVSALRDELLTRYAVDSETCGADVLSFLIEAHREGLIRIVTSPEATLSSDSSA